MQWQSSDILSVKTVKNKLLCPALGISSLDAAARICAMFYYAIWILPNNPSTPDVSLNQINEHQGQNWQSEFRWGIGSSPQPSK
jgi:hypothetical protein